MIGHVLADRYEIRKQLGKRAGRQTLLAWDRQVKSLVVVKLLSFSQEFIWDDLKLFEREAQTLRTLSHPAIPQYLDFFETSLPQAQVFALVQSYVEGDSLEAQVKAGRTFSELDVKQLATSLLEILIYLHGRQPSVIHRDIKPSNILLKNRSGNSVGDVYLVDFGSVQTLAATAGGTITVVGTYGYMPPEQFGGRVSPASDLYSLGATLIYVATGRHPADIPQKQLKLQFESLTTLNFELKQWLAQLVAPGLDERFAAAEAALQKLHLPTHRQTYVEKAASKVAPVAIAKPKGSSVQLSTSANRLTLQFPQKAVNKRTHRSLSFLKIAPVCLPASFIVAFINPVLSILVLIAWVSIPYIERGILKKLKRPLTKSNIFRIDRHQIALELYENDELKTSISSARQKIKKLEYRTNDEGYHSLKLWADKEYELGGNGLLSNAELKWLAYELGKWLNLPVERTRQEQHRSLPSGLFRKGLPQQIQLQAPPEKPINTEIILLKRPNWIDILIPVVSSQNTDEYTRLYIDNRQIHKTSASRKEPPPSMRIAISVIEYCSNSDESNGFLRVWAGTRQYSLGEDNSLSGDELKWLAYELSEWLGLPIYQTQI